MASPPEYMYTVIEGLHYYFKFITITFSVLVSIKTIFQRKGYHDMEEVWGYL